MCKNKPSLKPFLFLLGLVLTSCQGGPSPAASAGSPNAVGNVRVLTTEPVETRVDSETFNLPNCGGTSELEQTLGMQATVSKTVAIGEKATIRGGAETDIPETVKLKLEIEVEAAYQQTYQSVNSRLDSINMRAAAQTSVVYEIGWYEQTFSSIVEYTADNQIYQAPYVYKLHIPKIENSHQAPCPTQTPPEENWAVTFIYHFPPYFWSSGTHQYTFEHICPNVPDDSGNYGSKTNNFDVTTNAPVLAGEVYLRLNGLRDGPLEGQPIESINPAQPTAAAFNWINGTFADIELHAKDCRITISWDGGAPQALTPGELFSH